MLPAAICSAPPGEKGSGRHHLKFSSQNRPRYPHTNITQRCRQTWVRLSEPSCVACASGQPLRQPVPPLSPPGKRQHHRLLAPRPLHPLPPGHHGLGHWGRRHSSHKQQTSGNHRKAALCEDTHAGIFKTATCREPQICDNVSTRPVSSNWGLNERSGTLAQPNRIVSSPSRPTRFPRHPPARDHRMRAYSGEMT